MNTPQTAAQQLHALIDATVQGVFGLVIETTYAHHNEMATRNPEQRKAFILSKLGSMPINSPALNGLTAAQPARGAPAPARGAARAPASQPQWYTHAEFLQHCDIDDPNVVCLCTYERKGTPGLVCGKPANAISLTTGEPDYIQWRCTTHAKIQSHPTWGTGMAVGSNAYAAAGTNLPAPRGSIAPPQRPAPAAAQTSLRAGAAPGPQRRPPGGATPPAQTAALAPLPTPMPQAVARRQPPPRVPGGLTPRTVPNGITMIKNDSLTALYGDDVLSITTGHPAGLIVEPFSPEKQALAKNIKGVIYGKLDFEDFNGLNSQSELFESDIVNLVEVPQEELNLMPNWSYEFGGHLEQEDPQPAEGEVVYEDVYEDPQPDEEPQAETY